MPLVGQFVMGLVTKILANQLTRQNINDEIELIDKEVQHEFYKKDRLISILEDKLKSLEKDLDLLIAKKIDEIVKKVQEKTPFFVDPFVKSAGEAAKVELDKLTDDLVESILRLAENAKDKVEDATGLDFDNKSEDEIVNTPIPSPPGLSKKSKEILKNLKEKHQEMELPIPTDEEEGD
jgi:hypothetical protein